MHVLGRQCRKEPRDTNVERNLTSMEPDVKTYLSSAPSPPGNWQGAAEECDFGSPSVMGFRASYRASLLRSKSYRASIPGLCSDETAVALLQEQDRQVLVQRLQFSSGFVLRGLV
jgi:hypothetical protein